MDYERSEKQMENDVLQQCIKPVHVTEINPDNLEDYDIRDLLSYVEHEAITSKNTGRPSVKLHEVAGRREGEDFAKNINLEAVPTDKSKSSNHLTEKSFLLSDKVELSSEGFLLKPLDQVNEDSNIEGFSSSDIGTLNNLENEIQMLVQDLDKKGFKLDQKKKLESNKKKVKKEKKEKVLNQCKITKSELAQKHELNKKELGQTEQKVKSSKSGLKKKKEKSNLCNDSKVDVSLNSDLVKKSQNSIDSPKNEILEDRAGESQVLDKKVEETVCRYYGKDKNEIEKAKKALMNLKSGHVIGEEKERPNEHNRVSNSGTDMQIMRDSLKLESMSPMMIGGHTVRVNILSSHLVGEFKVTKTTTFKELRQLIQAKTSIRNWCFQDLNTKRPLQNEDKKRVLAPNTHITIAQVGLDLLIADSTLNGKQSICLNRDGSCAFRVFWWDQKFHTSRLVWLKFEPHQISVTGIGGSFKLFDFKTMRVPLIFAGVRGSQLAFQFIKGKSNLASRFYAANLEQKKMIGIFFLFYMEASGSEKGVYSLQE
ncbi:uncharacterized protein LOC126326555 [Schistocerca gregaria]|uniref:uncharacterized protein LOC126326555 n=1 Tax=Schistocerca gregaria TaxID=7010 RepID=UPI00211E0054|nr:uncharacterized protein LOC126326555 [Schistocerca gregaria]